MSLEKLDSFARKDDRDQASKPPGRRHKMASYGVPIGLGLGFAILLAILFGDRLIPAQTVDLVSVVTLSEDPGSAPILANFDRGSDSAFEAPVVFQASGWIEPDPLPVKATALISGVVDEVFVLEGESVREGDIRTDVINCRRACLTTLNTYKIPVFNILDTWQTYIQIMVTTPCQGLCSALLTRQAVLQQ